MILSEVSSYWTGKIDATTLDEKNYVSTENMMPDKAGIVTSGYVPTIGKTNSYSEKDILISNIRPYFKKIWFADKEGGCSNDVLVFRANRNIEPKYLYYQLSKDDFFDYMVAGSNGTKMPRGNKVEIMKYRINLPPLPTQRKIASILSAYDDLIENNLKRIKLLEEKAFVSYKLLVKSEKFKLEEFYETSSGGTPSRTNAEFFTGEINWFKSKELTDSVLLESEEKINEQAVDKSSAKLFPTGAVIMAMYGATIGKLGLLSMPSTTNQACCAIIPINDIKSNYYILNWLLENREYILSFRMGAAQENISQQVIRNLFVSFPIESDLKNFNQEMKPIYQLIKNLTYQNTKLREARDILLPKLMSGQIEI
ncbi:MAG: restriction endonuclease subunit S [Bacteroidetes bacterium]|nr:restriction endonuclease subunit S [Bacteroidota bacterium]